MTHLEFTMRKSIFAVSLLAAALVSPLANAYQQGDVIVRAGAALVDPNSSSDELQVNGVKQAGTKDMVHVGTDTQLGLTAVFMLQDHLGLELLAATPFKHDIQLKGVGKLATTKHLPPTLSLQYYPMDTASKFQPYAGIGVNYTTFFDESLTSEAEDAGFSDLNLDSSWGLAGQLGADYLITDNVLINAAVWYIDIDTQANMYLGNAKVKTDVTIDPWVYMVGMGYKF
jgi:outer membrane protein